MLTKTEATIDDLYQAPGKAELVDGALVYMSPTGFLPGRASGKIYVSLVEYEQRTGNGFAIPDNVGFVVNLPHPRSFSPDTAFYTGKATGMKFLEGAPVFAVEVRSEGDYGPQAEQEIAKKRADYFAAGTLVVWDVDQLGDDVLKVYRASAPTEPTVYRRGDMAEAEPAVPGWTLPVDTLLG